MIYCNTAMFIYSLSTLKHYNEYQIGKRQNVPYDKMPLPILVTLLSLTKPDTLPTQKAIPWAIQIITPTLDFICIANFEE